MSKDFKNITKDDIKDRIKDKFEDYANKKFKKKGKGFRRRKGKQISVGKSFNDVSYYTKNKTITDAFTNLPFSWIVGNPVVNLAAGLTIRIPAIVSYMIDWVANLSPSLTDNTDFPTGNDADILDQVATIIYAEMRRSNSGSTNNIEHVDVLISNLIASIDICVNVHYLHRMFKIANTFSWRNRLIPNYIFKHHFNIDYDDFIANQANYRGEFDTVIAMARTIRTLADFPFINSIMDEFDNIFKDSDTDNGREQLILSVKPVHHIYDPVGTEDAPGGMVRLMVMKDIGATEPTSQKRILWTGVPSNSSRPDHSPKLFKFGLFIKILRAQINALITDNDFNLIQADIEKAFGEQSGYIVVDPITTTEPITPIYSGEFNTMFKNGKFHYPSYQSSEQDDWGYRNVNHSGVGIAASLDPSAVVNTVYQKQDEDGSVRMKYIMAFVSALEQSPTAKNLNLNLLNLEADHPSVDEIVIATRFKHTPRIFSGSSLVSYGIPASFINTSELYVVPVSSSNFICWGGNVTLVSCTSSGVEISVVDWNNTTTALPMILLGMENPPQFVDSDGRFYDNINNIRGVSESELQPIQKACFLSLWNLPSRTNI